MLNQKQREQWERTRANGMWRFVLIWALALTGAQSVGLSIFDYFSSSSYRPSSELLMVRALIFLVVGIISGVVSWFIAEHRYKKSSGSAS